MIEHLRQFIDNKNKGGTNCQKVIGSKTNISRFARFWEHCQNELMVLASGRLHEYITEEDPSKAELEAFKKGMASIALFPGQCHEELEKEKRIEKLRDSS